MHVLCATRCSKFPVNVNCSATLGGLSQKKALLTPKKMDQKKPIKVLYLCKKQLNVRIE